MPNISVITIDGTDYDIKDAKSNKMISSLSDGIGIRVITYFDLEQGSFSGSDRKQDNNKVIRLKAPVYCPKGTKITFRTGSLYHVIWYMDSDNPDTATIYNSINRFQSTTVTVGRDCYVYMSFATGRTGSASSPISVDDFKLYSVLFEEGEIYDKELYLGTFIQKNTSETSQSSNTKRISMQNCVAFPYGGKTHLKIHLNQPYRLFLRAGVTAQNLNHALSVGWVGDGFEFDANGDQYYRFVLCKLDNPNVEHPSSASTYLNLTPENDFDWANLHIEYSLSNGKNDSTIEERNEENFHTLINSQNPLSASSHGNVNTFPVVYHASDFHGDIQRLQNALEFSEYCQADCAIFSGDIIAYKPYDNLEWMHDLFADYAGKPIICTGNHEVNDSSYTDAMVYAMLMEPSATKIGNTNGTTYYFTDIASKNLRVIVCDLYQYGATTRSNTHMSSEQLVYICNALKTAPNGYGILIVAHSPCVDIGSAMSQNYPTFFQQLRKYGHTHYDISGAPIYDIVDAFISRTTISRTYTQTGSPNSIEVNEDFSGVDSSVEFIAHLTGHIHEDTICYLPGTVNMQLMLNISCGASMVGGSSYPYLSDDCDITRRPYGKSQDIGNVYVIDRANKIVKVTRIGGTTTYQQQERRYMEIPYSV